MLKNKSANLLTEDIAFHLLALLLTDQLQNCYWFAYKNIDFIVTYVIFRVVIIKWINKNKTWIILFRSQKIFCKILTFFVNSICIFIFVVQLFGFCSYLLLLYYVLLYCICMCICNSFCVFMLVIQAKLSSETPVNLLQHFFKEFIANLWWTTYYSLNDLVYLLSYRY